MKKTKTIKVKGWAIISNGKLGATGSFYQPEMTLSSLAMAKLMMSFGIYVIGKGYEPQIVPCTISYSLNK